MSWAMTGCGDKITQSAFVVVVAFCNRHWEVAGFSLPLCFFNSKIHEFIPAILTCLFGSSQIAQRGGEVVHEEKRGREHTMSK